MNKKEIFKIIKENSYMKYCICHLIENIKDNRELRDLKKYLEQIIAPDSKPHGIEQYHKIDELVDKLKDK